jgi:hypothetical protein
MKQKFYLFLLICFSIFSAKGQIGGESTYQFLELTNSARMAALGGTQIAINDSTDLNLPFNNPALLHKQMHNKVLVNYVNSNDLPQPNPYPPNTDVPVGTYPAPNGIADDISAYTFNQIAVPSPIIQAGLGLAAGTEIKVRWMPTITNEDFSFNYFGIGGMHSISQWIPVFDDLPIDISAFVGYTKIDAEYVIPPGNIAGSGQKTQFSVNTLTYQALVSAHISILTAYAGIGMDNFTTNFRMLGTYDLYSTGEGDDFDLSLSDPINLEQSGNSSFRTTLGARLKLAILTIHADYTFREYNTLTAGLGFSIR